MGTFVRTFTASSEVDIAPTLGNLDPATVWNVAAFEIPDGNLTTTRPLFEYNLGSAQFKQGVGKEAGLTIPAATEQQSTPQLSNKWMDDQGSVVVQMYKVYRSTSPDALNTGTMVATVDPGSTHYSDRGLADKPVRREYMEEDPSTLVSEQVRSGGGRHACFVYLGETGQREEYGFPWLSSRWSQSVD